MIGIYNYTVVLTYMSLVSAITGIIVGLNGSATGCVICLLICGLCDMFDGAVARTKKNRTAFEKDFGIQIDSLSDLIAFGVLPIILGYSLNLIEYYYIPIYVIFVLAGLIRLAYFNCLELKEQRDKTKTNKFKTFTGLPIPASALICPVLYLFRGLSWFNYLYAGSLLVIAILYISNFKIKKPNNKVISWIIIIGVIEFLLVLFK